MIQSSIQKYCTDVITFEINYEMLTQLDGCWYFCSLLRPDSAYWQDGSPVKNDGEVLHVALPEAFMYISVTPLRKAIDSI